ncbi:hypothetical protein FJTKL_11930 [Diaporthe vaccinii]|uniref:Uncharacterized protein n=1 Tax=Diaporthe vaccinii TaxID=105482 RepID=A0ABR4FAK1_9PEZI
MGSKIDALSHAFDFCISITAFGLFLTAFVGDFRQKLWYRGGTEGWNSNPNERIHCDLPGHCHELPEPLVWSQQLTEAMLAVALLSLTLLVTRIVLGISRQTSRTISIIYDSLLAFFWFRLLLSQASGDFSDPRHPSPRPWYLVRKCPTDTAAACYVAQASFAISVLAALFYGGRFLAAAIEMVVVWARAQEDGYQLVAMNSDLVDEDAAAREKERYWHLYEDALSPVLAFFPQNVR